MSTATATKRQSPSCTCITARSGVCGRWHHVLTVGWVDDGIEALQVSLGLHFGDEETLSRVSLGIILYIYNIPATLYF